MKTKDNTWYSQENSKMKITRPSWNYERKKKAKRSSPAAEWTRLRIISVSRTIRKVRFALLRYFGPSFYVYIWVRPKMIYIAFSIVSTVRAFYIMHKNIMIIMERVIRVKGLLGLLPQGWSR